MPNIQFTEEYLLTDTIMGWGWVLPRLLELMNRKRVRRSDEEIAVTVKPKILS